MQSRVSTIVTLKEINKVYGEGVGRVDALRDIDLEIQAGEFLALCGPSGSGKTTLLNLIGALDLPTSGRIEVEGRDLQNMSRRQLAYLRRDRIGFVFQSHNLIPILTAYENAEFTLALQKVPFVERRRRALAALASVGLAEMANRKPSELSGGQQQRVAVARAIAPSPAIVLADEPTASLDAASASSLLELMQELNRQSGVTFIFSTHDPRVMERARRIVKLADGRILSKS